MSRRYLVPLSQLYAASSQSTEDHSNKALIASNSSDFDYNHESSDDTDNTFIHDEADETDVETEVDPPAATPLVPIPPRHQPPRAGQPPAWQHTSDYEMDT